MILSWELAHDVCLISDPDMAQRCCDVGKLLTKVNSRFHAPPELFKCFMTFQDAV